ncbi:hypothetical protein B0H11DRAFT_2226069 [Mycena galericulata]|nr:hypothetical protein B0H11DRAFT_2226069 [Mycena galericulata]
MDLQETLRTLRNQAQIIPSAPAPYLRQRKALPGTSSFSLTDAGTVTVPPLFSTDLNHQNAPNTPTFASGVQFRPLMTPSSFPRIAARPYESMGPMTPFPISSSLGVSNDDDLFQNTELPDLSPDYSEPELDGLNTDSDSFRRRRSTDSYTKISTILAGLRKDRISPIDVLIQVLDSEDMSYNRYRGNLYRDDSHKLSILLAKIMEDSKGKKKLLECMQPHLLAFACKTSSS